MAATKVVLIVAHPAIAAGLETLLKLEGDYDIRRLPSFTSMSMLGSWKADAALVDGTLLIDAVSVTLGAPALVLSGNERDGKALAQRLDDGRGWLRKDATGAELAAAINALVGVKSKSGLGPFGVIAIVLLAISALLVILYLLWLATY